MTPQELQQFLQAMATLRQANTATPEKAREFLIEEGVLTPDGRLAEPYASKSHGTPEPQADCRAGLL
jgi:hypothetical protein